MRESKDTPGLVRILLGGGIGAGKSAAGRRFSHHGAIVVEADRVGHAVLAHEGEAASEVSRRWPAVVSDGTIDRTSLATIVFDDPVLLAELEAMTHPAIITRIGTIAQGPDDLVVEVPLILDIPGVWTNIFIDADEDVRIRRAVERGNDEADVRKRMASQPSRDEWMRWSTVLIDNNGSAEDLDRQIDALWYGLHP